MSMKPFRGLVDISELEKGEKIWDFGLEQMEG